MEARDLAGSRIVLVSIAVAVVFIVRPVLAQEASTSAPVDNSSTSTEPVPTDSASLMGTTTTELTPADSSTTPAATAAPAQDTSTSQPAPEQPPAGLTKVNIIGTKYMDYFTDGTNIIPFPGDPKIDAHLSEKDAPIPTHQGLTWVHTTGQYLYDTQSGDLEVGQYAVQPNGSYIQNAQPFVSSTSTPATVESSATPSSEATGSGPAQEGSSTASVVQSGSSTPDTSPSSSPATTTPQP